MIFIPVPPITKTRPPPQESPLAETWLWKPLPSPTLPAGARRCRPRPFPLLPSPLRRTQTAPHTRARPPRWAREGTDEAAGGSPAPSAISGASLRGRARRPHTHTLPPHPRLPRLPSGRGPAEGELEAGTTDTTIRRSPLRPHSPRPWLSAAQPRGWGGGGGGPARCVRERSPRSIGSGRAAVPVRRRLWRRPACGACALRTGGGASPRPPLPAYPALRGLRRRVMAAGFEAWGAARVPLRRWGDLSAGGEAAHG